VHRWRTTVAALAILAGGYVAGEPDAPDPGAQPIQLTGSRDPGRYGFVIDGKPARGLYPGGVKDIAITLRNTYPFALKVVSLRGRIVSSSSRRCRVGSTTMVVRPHVGTLPMIVPAHSRRTAGAIPVFMPTDASPDCQGATFTVHIVGSATKAPATKARR
jgi:hypothetical protein